MREYLLRPTSDGDKWLVLPRLMAGSVFFWEGLLKLVYANQGVGRFTKLGFPFPGVTAGGVALFEIVGGALLLAGLFTRVLALLFVVEMVVAIFSTKIALYLGSSPLPLPPAPPRIGMWAVLHEIRSDWAQLLTSLFLFFTGAGIWSLDARRSRHFSSAKGQAPV